MNKQVFVFVGEFSYALNWFVPLLRKECKTTYKNTYNIIVTFPNLKKLYEDFISEYHPLPDELVLKLKRPSTIGERDVVNGNVEDRTPSFIIEYIQRIYPNCPIKLSPDLKKITRNENPNGYYEHYHPSSESNSIVLNFLKFRKCEPENTLVLMPKHRNTGGNASGQNWQKQKWELFINRIIKELNYNIISFYFEEKNSEGGSYQLPITSSKFTTIKNPNFDFQLAFLKNTKYSIYGSTGANNIPFFANTPMITYVKSTYGKRLFFEWQKKLTNNHEKQKIVLVDEMESYTVDQAFSELLDYEKNKIQYR
jgi:hypothetical protein